jgi:glucose dehydrogenase
MIVTMRFLWGLLALLIVIPGWAQEAGAARSNWPSHGGSQYAWRYSVLDQINASNVKNLAAIWTFQTGDYGDSLQSTPLVIDGVMYVSTSYAQVFALDAATGRALWHYKYPLRANVGKSGGEAFRINRGLAVSDGKVFLGTPDSYLVAIDQKTGGELWRVNVDDSNQCGCSITSAPLVVKDKVVVGGSGGDNAHRGYLTAFDAKTRSSGVALVRDSGSWREGSRDLEGR